MVQPLLGTGRNRMVLRMRPEQDAAHRGASKDRAVTSGTAAVGTERQKGTSQAKLARTVSLLHATLDATADGLLVVDRSGMVVAFNRRFLQLWQIPEGVLARRRDAQTHDDLLLEYVRDQLEDPDDFMRGVCALYDHPERESFDALRFKDGRVFERYSRPQRIGEDGPIEGRVWSFRDVSERERLLGRATFLSEVTRLLVSLDVEKALEAVAHLSIPYLGDRCAIDLFEESGPRRLLAVSRDPAEASPADLPHTVLSGHATTFASGGRACMAIPLRAHSKATLGAMIFAASHRRYGASDVELGEMLGERVALCIVNARLFRDAQDALRMRADFLSIVAHEIRSPLTSMHLSVQRLRRRPLPPSDLARALDLVEREDRRLGRFVDELLDVGRIQAGRFAFDFQEVDFSAVVRAAAAPLAGELARSRSSLAITTESTLLGHWDRFRLEQVVMNLLSNAIKFGLGKPIEVSLAASDRHAVLRVTDHGHGIASGMREKIFLPFERAVSARHYGGLGLGLYIVRTIVTGMGGTVGVESEPGAGTSFVVTLPRQAPSG
jgi:signal transduction histidine kinase/PAS domain-containing protein